MSPPTSQPLLRPQSIPLRAFFAMRIPENQPPYPAPTQVSLRPGLRPCQLKSPSKRSHFSPSSLTPCAPPAPFRVQNPCETSFRISLSLRTRHARRRSLRSWFSTFLADPRALHPPRFLTLPSLPTPAIKLPLHTPALETPALLLPAHSLPLLPSLPPSQVLPARPQSTDRLREGRRRPQGIRVLRPPRRREADAAPARPGAEGDGGGAGSGARRRRQQQRRRRERALRTHSTDHRGSGSRGDSRRARRVEGPAPDPAARRRSLGSGRWQPRSPGLGTCPPLALVIPTPLSLPCSSRRVVFKATVPPPPALSSSFLEGGPPSAEPGAQ